MYWKKMIVKKRILKQIDKNILIISLILNNIYNLNYNTVLLYFIYIYSFYSLLSYISYISYYYTQWLSSFKKIFLFFGNYEICGIINYKCI